MKFTIIASVLAYANSSTDQLLTKARDITLACLLFSLALTLNGLQLNAQTGFLNHEYTWTESFSCFGSQWTETYRYTIDSVSTDINGKDYFELLVSETYLGNNFEGTGKFIRSDDSNRVFSYDGELEKILYDFNLMVGDTFETNNDYDCDIVVGEIDTIMLENGEPRLKWIFYDSGDDYHPEFSFGYPFWIEGIGHQYGLFGNDQMCQIDGCGTYLLCMNFQDTLIYMSNLDSCWVTISSTINSYGASIQIFPNPVSETLKISDPDLQIESIRILNLHGSLLIEKYQSEINTRQLLPGFYFLQMKLKNGLSVTRTLIKI